MALLVGSGSLEKDRSSAGEATSLLLRFLWHKKETENNLGVVLTE
jgi:hypothetical protein